jgi:DNA-binding MarR family transcriptional regulator
MAEIKAVNLKREINETLEGNGINNNEIKIFLGDRKVKEQEPFIKLFQAQSNVVKYLKPVSVKIFHYFLCELQYGNYVEADIKAIALINDISQISVKRAIKELIEVEVIIIDKDLNDRRRNTYFINPYLAWKGNAGDRIKSVKKLEKEKQQLTIGFPIEENKK